MNFLNTISPSPVGPPPPSLSHSLSLSFVSETALLRSLQVPFALKSSFNYNCYSSDPINNKLLRPWLRGLVVVTTGLKSINVGLNPGRL